MVHGKMIRQLLERMSQDQEVELTYLRFLTYNDLQLCSMFVVRSMFDYFEWLPKIYAPLFARAEKELAHFHTKRIVAIDPSIDNPALREIFAAQREVENVWKSCSDRASGPSEVVYVWIAAKRTLHAGQSIYIAVEALDKLDAPFFQEPESAVLAQAYSALTALYCAESLRGRVLIEGVEVFDTERPTLSRLKNVLEKALSTQSSEDLERYGNAMLWALFVGAQGEQRRTGTFGWFSEELGKLAIRRKVMTWTELRTILEGFLYDDLLQPHGTHWFWKIVGDRLAEQG